MAPSFCYHRKKVATFPNILHRPAIFSDHHHLMIGYQLVSFYKVAAIFLVYIYNQCELDGGCLSLFAPIAATWSCPRFSMLLLPFLKVQQMYHCILPFCQNIFETI